MAKPLFALNPQPDRAALAERFARERRIQIPDLLTRETAEELRLILARHTARGVAIRTETGRGEPPRSLRAQEPHDPAAAPRVKGLGRAAGRAAAERHYAFRSLRCSRGSLSGQVKRGRSARSAARAFRCAPLP